jgi:RNA-directed DNA polymerase
MHIKTYLKNKGSFSLGICGYTVENYNRAESINITKLLKTKTFIPEPVKRVFVPKPGKSTLRPLGIPTFKDRIVQEAMRSMLEAIYEPEFRRFEVVTKKCTNFGFRPNKSCWDSINNFTTYAQKCTFVIEGDIKGAFNNVVHKKLIEIISIRVKDKNFINLLKLFLKAGIMVGNQYEHSLLGVPQGGILSPLLFNIYMFEFDKFIYYEIIKKYETIDPPSKKTKTYQNLLYKRNKELKEYRLLLHTIRDYPKNQQKNYKLALNEKRNQF